MHKIIENILLLKDKSVLLAEDDAITRQQMSNILTIIFSKVFTATNGEEAYRIYEEESPDIIITDIIMPKKDGLSLIHKIRQENYNIPIIVLSSFAEKEMLMNANNLSVDGYLIKPASLEKLTSTLCTAIQRSHNEIGIVQLNHELFYHSTTKELYRNTSLVMLGEKELALLNLLIMNPHQTITKEEIEKKLWPLESISNSAIKKLIHRIREKLKCDIIVSVRGIGYRLDTSKGPSKKEIG